MDAHKPAAAHRPGETTGTAERGPQRLAETILTFKLDQELRQLRAEQPWRTGDRNAKTLVKTPHLTVVLIALHAGSQLAEHQINGRISIQTVAGHVQLRLADAAIALPTGSLASLEDATTYTIEAQEDSAILLTIGQQEGHPDFPA